MSEELKPCPFCGGTKICTEKGINPIYCDNCLAESNVEHWNTRPIEDALTARIAALKRVIEILEDHQREVKNILIDKNLHIDSLYEEGFKLQHRIAELEAENDRLQSGWFRDETICPDGSLRPKVSDLLLNLDGWKERSNGWESIVETLNTRIAELESAQRWTPVSEGTKGLEILEDYLTTDESGEISKMKYCGVLRGVQKWLWSDNAFYHPTHWMPLPQLPEERER